MQGNHQKNTPCFQQYTGNVLVPGLVSIVLQGRQCRSAARSTDSEVKLFGLKPAAQGRREDFTRKARERSPGRAGARLWSTRAIFSCYRRDKSCRNEAGEGGLSEALRRERRDRARVLMGKSAPSRRHRLGPKRGAAHTGRPCRPSRVIQAELEATEG